ncbi:Transposase and inactivated derivatives [Salmonella enterica subsp. arizonae]|nr:Transposase and inactivated derivatives [Salmonella enterica subsp. arizonae]
MNIPNIFSMKVEPTTEQKVAPEGLQRQSRDHHVRDRIRCVLLSSESWSTAMIAQSRRIHETTVLRHISDYLRSEKLAPENGGSDSHLSEVQTAELTEYLTNNFLPTTLAIIEMVDEWWGVCYTVAGMTKWLQRNGFSYRKPVMMNRASCSPDAGSKTGV